MIQSVNSSSLYANQLLQRHAKSEMNSMVRLATMRRINSGADDPAGLIAAVQLESNIRSIEEAIHEHGRPFPGELRATSRCA